MKHFMKLNGDLKITLFDIHQARVMAADPNPQIAGTATAMVQLVEACADIAESGHLTQAEIVEQIRNLTIDVNNELEG